MRKTTHNSIPSDAWDKKPHTQTVQMRHVREDEYTRLLFENQRMIGLLETVLQQAKSAYGSTPLAGHNAMLSRISLAVDEIRNPLLDDTSLAPDNPDNYARIMHTTKQAFELCGIPVYVDPTLAPHEIRVGMASRDALMHSVNLDAVKVLPDQT